MSNAVLVEWFDSHYYKVIKDGVATFIPSVTTKLGIIDKPFLAKWRGDIGNREADMRMNEASQRGTRIHYAWSVALKGGAVIYDPWNKPVFTPEGLAEARKQYGEVAILKTQDEQYQVFKLYRQFEALKPTVIGVEETLYSVEEMIAGTADHIYFIEEGDYAIAGRNPLHLQTGLYLGDLKTGNVVEENVWLQIAPYVHCYEKMHGVKLVGGLVTHTSSKTKAGIQGLTTLLRTREQLFDKDLPDYFYAAKLWERNHADDKPETYEFPALLTLNIKGEINGDKLQGPGNKDVVQVSKDRVGTPNDRKTT